MQSMQSVWRLGSISRKNNYSEPLRFRCSHCGASFTRKEHLIRHERAHDAVRPYKCSICQSAFGRKDLLNRHMKNCVKNKSAGLKFSPTVDSIKSPSEQSSSPSPTIEDSQVVIPSITIPHDVSSCNSPVYEDFDYKPTAIAAEYTHNSLKADDFFDYNLSEFIYDFPSSGGEICFRNMHDRAFCQRLMLALQSVTDEQSVSFLTTITAQQLDVYVQAFINGPSYQLPILHSSVFEFEDLNGLGNGANAVSASILFLAVASIGAVYCSQRRISHSFRDLCRRCIGQLDDTQSLNILQARLLCSIYDAWSGDRKLINVALDEQPLLFRLCSRAAMKNIDRVVRDRKTWILRESTHRLFWGQFTFMSDLNIAFGGIIFEPGLVMDSIPLPELDVIWNEPDEEKWKQLVSSLPPPLTVNETLSIIFSESPTTSVLFHESQCYSFSISILLRFLLRYIVATKQIETSSKSLKINMSAALHISATDLVDRLLVRILPKLSCTELVADSTFETLMQTIRLLKSDSFQRFSILQELLLHEDCQHVVSNFLAKPLERSKESTKAVAICLQHLEPYFFRQTRIVSARELFSTWNSITPIICWMQTVETTDPILDEENQVMDQIKRIVVILSKSSLSVARIPLCLKSYAASLAIIWRDILDRQDIYEASTQMVNFLDGVVSELINQYGFL